MALRYYDDALAEKLKRWMPTNSNLRILKPNEVKRFFETNADDTNDKHLELPCITLSRSPDVELLLNTANARSYDGLRLERAKDTTIVLNQIPVKLVYQMDIFAKNYDEADEYLRNFLFKLINNPVIHIQIPYRGSNRQHIANIRVLSNVTDTSDISERLYPGQFTRWTINLEIIDAFLFDIQYKDNWKFIYDDDDDTYTTPELGSELEVANSLTVDSDADFSERIGIEETVEHINH